MNKKIKNIYYSQNIKSDYVEYSNTELNFSLNTGDYIKPNL